MGRRLTARAKTASTSSAPPAKGSVMGDNRLAQERAEQAQLLSIVSRLRQHAPAIEKAKAALETEKATEKEIYRLARVAGFEKPDIMEFLEDLKPGKGHEVEEREVKRIRRRRWLGLAIGEVQEDLESRMPEESRDEQYWSKQAFAHGLTGGSTMDPLPDGLPTRFTQLYLRAVDAGRTEGLKLIADNLPASQRAAAVAGAEAIAAVQKDNPEIDVGAAARKLKADPKFMDRSAPGDGAEAGSAATSPGAADFAAPAPDEGFEATEEELAAQKGRQAVQDAREGRTSGEAADPAPAEVV